MSQQLEVMSQLTQPIGAECRPRRPNRTHSIAGGQRRLAAPSPHSRGRRVGTRRFWITVVKNPDTYRRAGELGAGILTDADNSVHLGQIGLLLQKLIENNTRVVWGNRKHPDAVLVKQESRWGIGIKLLRHMQRMVGQVIFSRGILDTQGAFKLYHREVLEKIIQNPTVYDFSFDTDWILATIAMNEPFETVPFAFIDSFAESASITQGPMTTWETLLKGLVKAVRKHQVPHNKAMARILDEEIHSSADLDLLIHHLPPELEEIKSQDLGNPAIMSPESVQAWSQKRKGHEALSPTLNEPTLNEQSPPPILIVTDK